MFPMSAAVKVFLPRRKDTDVRFIGDSNLATDVMVHGCRSDSFPLNEKLLDEVEISTIYANFLLNSDY